MHINTDIFEETDRGLIARTNAVEVDDLFIVRSFDDCILHGHAVHIPTRFLVD